ncbi:hypothetical protein PHYPSEUDO_003143 [Phytophthora pseudosyringae]|uniref:Uncharacterized protein n=1 Tax=Phytophthora pseudosyringae TaxID=221518 RepID=A0A8T1VWN7_9STRA|nr:hypothetical protein PHYPSEUDO_003143 [Phytophthora pseudosyringae]
MFAAQAIHPDGSASHSVVHTPKPRGFVQHVQVYVAKLARIWLSLQVSHHGGEYSMERFVALDEYVQQSSQVRVLMVCLGTPLPMIIFTVLQEVVPLQELSEGWLYNYGFWIRYALLGGVLTHAIGVHGTYMIGGVTFSTAQLVLLDLLVAIGFVPISGAIAAFWAFPIPFVQISTNMIFITMVLVSFRGIISREAFYQLLSRRTQLLRYLSFLLVQVFMTIVYPSYQVLFDFAADTGYELAVFLLLPVIKIVMKNVLSLAVSHMEDLIPETVIFTVDFFNALYLATCMQRATSSITVAVVVVIDLTQTAFALHRLHRHTKTILARLRQALEAKTTCSRVDLLSSIRALYDNPRKLKRQTRGNIRVYSCMPHRLTKAGTGHLGNLHRQTSMKGNTQFILPFSLSSYSDLLHSDECKAGFDSARFSKPTKWFQHGSASVKPVKNPQLDSTQPLGNRKVIAVNGTDRRNAEEFVLHQTLEVLFTSECLLLAEYLEVVIPLLYGNYVLMMVNLPNAKYHTELAGITREHVGPTVQTVFVYALLEFVSFAVLIAVLQRDCGVKGLYQLAFVLETHMPLVQTKLVSWVLITLSYRVIHFGKL